MNEKGRMARTDERGVVEFLGVSLGRRLLAVRAFDYGNHRQWVNIDGTQELVEITVKLQTK